MTLIFGLLLGYCWGLGRVENSLSVYSWMWTTSTLYISFYSDIYFYSYVGVFIAKHSPNSSFSWAGIVFNLTLTPPTHPSIHPAGKVSGKQDRGIYTYELSSKLLLASPQTPQKVKKL